MDQAWFCSQVAGTNKLEFLKWAREEKHCEWDEETIATAAAKGNLEMLKSASLTVARVIKEMRVDKLRLEDTSTVFDFLSTK